MEGNNAQYTPEALTGLTRGELRRMLAAELHKDTTCMDDNLVRMLLRALEARGPDPAFTDDSAVEAACEKFRADTQKAQRLRKRWYQSRMLKAASAVLVLGILFFALPGAAQADNIQEVLCWWSDSVFQLFTPGKHPTVQEYVYETDHPGLQQIYDTVAELGITEPVVPRYISKEFELIELKTYQMTGHTSIYANLASDERNVSITITICGTQNSLTHEKSMSDVSIWDLAGREHYILNNNNELIVTWIAAGLECTVIADCSQEEVYRIIKSIYTLER